MRILKKEIKKIKSRVYLVFQDDSEVGWAGGGVRAGVTGPPAGHNGAKLPQRDKASDALRRTKWF